MTGMKHRHLVEETLSLAAIDDVIARGRRYDWSVLRNAMRADETVKRRIISVCEARVSDPYAQRYHFWKYYAERNIST